MKMERWCVNNIRQTDEHGAFRLESTMSEENPHCRSRARLVGLFGTATRVRRHAAQTATLEEPADIPSLQLSSNKDFDFPFSVIPSHKQNTSPLKAPLLYWTFTHRGSSHNSALMNLLKVLRSKELKRLLSFISKMHTHRTICPHPDSEEMAYIIPSTQEELYWWGIWRSLRICNKVRKEKQTKKPHKNNKLM